MPVREIPVCIIASFVRSTLICNELSCRQLLVPRADASGKLKRGSPSLQVATFCQHICLFDCNIFSAYLFGYNVLLVYYMFVLDISKCHAIFKCAEVAEKSGIILLL